MVFAGIRRRRRKRRRQALLRIISGKPDQNSLAPGQAQVGSLWSPDARFGDLGADLRARHVDDVVTIVVQESGIRRIAEAQSHRPAHRALRLAWMRRSGPRNSGWLPNMASMSGQQQAGRAGRNRPRNSPEHRAHGASHSCSAEWQSGDRGRQDRHSQLGNPKRHRARCGRPFDLSTANAIQSDQIAMLEVSVAGKGVVGDAVRQPNILYRLLLGCFLSKLS